MEGRRQKKVIKSESTLKVNEVSNLWEIDVYETVQPCPISVGGHVYTRTLHNLALLLNLFVLGLNVESCAAVNFNGSLSMFGELS